MVSTKQDIMVGEKLKPKFDAELNNLICKYTGWDKDKIEIVDVTIMAGKQRLPQVTLSVVVRE